MYISLRALFSRALKREKNGKRGDLFLSRDEQCWLSLTKGKRSDRFNGTRHQSINQGKLFLPAALTKTVRSFNPT